MLLAGGLEERRWWYYSRIMKIGLILHVEEEALGRAWGGDGETRVWYRSKTNKKLAGVSDASAEDEAVVEVKVMKENDNCAMTMKKMKQHAARARKDVAKEVVAITARWMQSGPTPTQRLGSWTMGSCMRLIEPW